MDATTRTAERRNGENMMPTREQLEEARHVGYCTFDYFTAFCNLNRSCEECDSIIRFGCKVKNKIEEFQKKRVLRICKPEPPKEEI